MRLIVRAEGYRLDSFCQIRVSRGHPLETGWVARRGVVGAPRARYGTVRHVGAHHPWQIPVGGSTAVSAWAAQEFVQGQTAGFVRGIALKWHAACGRCALWS